MRNENINLLPFCPIRRREWHFTLMKMAKTSSSGPNRENARGVPLELVSTIFGPTSIRAKLLKSIIRPFQIRSKVAGVYQNLELQMLE
jgi:hypothetical protein